MKQKFSCVNCGGSKQYSVLSGKTSEAGLYSLVKCINCGLISLHPKPSQYRLYSTFYEDYRSPVTGQRFPLPIDATMKIWRYLRAYRMSKLARDGKILDVGCGQGIELQILKKFHFQVAGVEKSKKYAQSISKQTGIHIYSGDFANLAIPPSSIGLISFLHSLEHIPNPFNYLKKSYQLLKPGGNLLISIPNFNSVERKLFNSSWFHLDIPRHLHFFSDDWLAQYLTGIGFRYVRRKRVAPEYDFYSIIQSCLNKYFFDQNFLYQMLLKEKGKNQKKYNQLIRRLPIYVLSAVIAIPITISLFLLNSNGTVEMVFRKPEK